MEAGCGRPHTQLAAATDAGCTVRLKKALEACGYMDERGDVEWHRAW